MNNNCPMCGSQAKLLLNLVDCLTPTCRNFSSGFLTEWQSRNNPIYSHRQFGAGYTFLGNFTSKHGTQFDMYHCTSHAGDDLCAARCGNSDLDCYYIDSKETEIFTSSGPVAAISKCVEAALKEALGSWRRQ